jgi:hypothetical protein
VREEVLEARFTELLGRLRFDDEVLDWVREALQASHADQRREHQEAIERLRVQHKRLGERISAMYIDKLDGKIGGDFYDKFAGEWREEQFRLQRDRHEAAEQSYMDEGVQILELARNAQRLFERQEPRQKRRLLNFVLSNCSWDQGQVRATFRQPFDLLAETAAIASRREAGNTANLAKGPGLEPCLQYRRGYPDRSKSRWLRAPATKHSRRHNPDPGTAAPEAFSFVGTVNLSPVSPGWSRSGSRPE